MFGYELHGRGPVILNVETMTDCSARMDGKWEPELRRQENIILQFDWIKE